MGVLFIVIVLFLPNGLVSIVDVIMAKRRRRVASKTVTVTQANEGYVIPRSGADMENGTFLRLENIIVEFGGFRAVDGLNST